MLIDFKANQQFLTSDETVNVFSLLFSLIEMNFTPSVLHSIIRNETLKTYMF